MRIPLRPSYTFLRTHSLPLAPVPYRHTIETLGRLEMQEAVSAQQAEGAAKSSKSVDIWGSTRASSESSKAPAQAALTQRGFMILVKLIEELQFEKELEQEKGVGLVPGPVYVV